MTKKRPFKVKWKRLVWITVTTRKRRGDILQHLISLVHHLPPSCLSLLLHFDFTLFANLPTHVVQESRRVGWRTRHSSWNGYWMLCADLDQGFPDTQTARQEMTLWPSDICWSGENKWTFLGSQLEQSPTSGDHGQARQGPRLTSKSKWVREPD